MSRAKKMKKEKKLNKLFKVFGFIIGGIIGTFLGYQLAQFSRSSSYDDVSTLSFFLTVVLGSIGCISGFAMTTMTSKNQSHR